MPEKHVGPLQPGDEVSVLTLAWGTDWAKSEHGSTWQTGRTHGTVVKSGEGEAWICNFGELKGKFAAWQRKVLRFENRPEVVAKQPKKLQTTNNKSCCSASASCSASSAAAPAASGASKKGGGARAERAWLTLLEYVRSCEGSSAAVASVSKAWKCRLEQRKSNKEGRRGIEYIAPSGHVFSNLTEVATHLGLTPLSRRDGARYAESTRVRRSPECGAHELFLLTASTRTAARRPTSQPAHLTASPP